MFKDRVRKLFNGKIAIGPIHFFLLPTIAYGIGFAFFSTSDEVGKSSLFQSMVNLGSPVIAVCWGAVLFLVFLGSVATMVFKNWFIGTTTTFVGFLAWIFATLMYLQDHLYMLTVGVTLPNVFFWLWLYLRMKQDNSTAHMMRP